MLINIKDFILLILSPFQYLYRKIFWKNHSIVYINDNKKKTDLRDLTKIFNIKHSKTINIYSDAIRGSNPKIHLSKMKWQYKLIKRNICEENELFYYGFVSTPFAVFDGYSLGDNHTYQLGDKRKESNEVTSLVFSKKMPKNFINTDYDIKTENEINLFIESTCEIHESLINNGLSIYKLAIPKATDKLTDNYLNIVYYMMMDFMDQASAKGVKVLICIAAVGKLYLLLPV